MIRFALACDQGHDFESWFPSGASYEAQVARGLVSCPVCESTKVMKQLMAPSIGRKGAAKAAPEPSAPAAETPPTPPQPMAILSEREQALRTMLRAVREHVTKTSDYVGTGFVDEARRMHYGETPHRSIYGEANALDAKALVEEGIEIQALPVLPDDRN